VTSELLTIAEVAKLLHVSRGHAYDLIAEGKLRSLRVGRAIRVPRTALDAFIRQAPEPVEVPTADRTFDAEELAEAARGLRAANAETYIQALVDGFPPLTEAQRERLRELLR
jgi:excisionase family DNA binding protein